MNTLICESIGERLYTTWIHQTHPDTPVNIHSNNCAFAKQLTTEMILPFHRDFIVTIITFGYDGNEMEQLRYLYQIYNNINDPYDLDALVVELYLMLMEQYHMPFHVLPRLLDCSGTLELTN